MSTLDPALFDELLSGSDVDDLILPSFSFTQPRREDHIDVADALFTQLQEAETHVTPKVDPLSLPEPQLVPSPMASPLLPKSPVQSPNPLLPSRPQLTSPSPDFPDALGIAEMSSSQADTFDSKTSPAAALYHDSPSRSQESISMRREKTPRIRESPSRFLMGAPASTDAIDDALATLQPIVQDQALQDARLKVLQEELENQRALYEAKLALLQKQLAEERTLQTERIGLLEMRIEDANRAVEAEREVGMEERRRVMLSLQSEIDRRVNEAEHALERERSRAEVEIKNVRETYTALLRDARNAHNQQLADLVSRVDVMNSSISSFGMTMDDRLSVIDRLLEREKSLDRRESHLDEEKRENQRRYRETEQEITSRLDSVREKELAVRRRILECEARERAASRLDSDLDAERARLKDMKVNLLSKEQRLQTLANKLATLSTTVAEVQERPTPTQTHSVPLSVPISRNYHPGSSGKPAISALDRLPRRHTATDLQDLLWRVDSTLRQSRKTVLSPSAVSERKVDLGTIREEAEPHVSAIDDTIASLGVGLSALTPNPRFMKTPAASVPL